MKHWILTYFQATQILHAWGERAWPWNVRFIWSVAAEDVASILQQQQK